MNFCLDLEELKNCKAELSINSHIDSFENAQFYDQFKNFFYEYIKTIGHLVFWEMSARSHIDVLKENFKNTKIELVDYRYYHSRPIGIIEMLSDLKQIAKLANTGVYLSNQLVINVDTTSKYIESKVVEIIDSQAELDYVYIRFKNRAEFYFRSEYSSTKNKKIMPYLARARHGVLCIIKHCNKLGLEAITEILNKSPHIPFILSVSSVSEMNKFYQLCQNGLKLCVVKVEADVDQSDQMINIIIDSLKRSQTKIVHIQLNGFHPKHVFKILKESKGIKQQTSVKFSVFKAEQFEEDMFDIYQFACPSEFKNLIEESLFSEVELLYAAHSIKYNGKGDFLDLEIHPVLRHRNSIKWGEK